MLTDRPPAGERSPTESQRGGEGRGEEQVGDEKREEKGKVRGADEEKLRQKRKKEHPQASTSHFCATSCSVNVTPGQWTGLM